MELKLIHILGPVMATIAMLFYGSLLSPQQKGRHIRIAPALLFMIAAILFRVFYGEGTFLDRTCLVLLDFGIAMIIDSKYLKTQDVQPKIFWVPGVLALVISFTLYFIASLFGWTVNGLFDDSESAPLVRDEVTVSENEALPLKAPQYAELLLELGPDDEISELQKILMPYDVRYEQAFPMVTLTENEDLAQVYLLRVPFGSGEMIKFLLEQDQENVDAVSFNPEIALDPLEMQTSQSYFSSDYLADDPGIGQQWWMAPAEINRVHTLLKENPPQKKAIVAIVDTGIDNKHEDLKSSVNRKRGQIGDKQGHGTHCAGLAGAPTNNDKGIASLNWEGKFIELRSYKALDDNGRGSVYKVSRAIISAAEDGADVISLSLGSQERFPNKTQVDAVKYALSLGCIVVAAAGNNGGQDARRHSPSNIKGVISVAAMNSELRRAPFSNINTKLAMPLAAPGAAIYSTFPDNEYKSFNGTSMATPIVSGLCGILRAYRPDISPGEAWQILHDTGKLTADSKDTGHMVDALALMSQLLDPVVAN